MIFLSYILICLAAICNAFMDKIENSIQFNNSIFRNLNPEFWCKTISAHSTKFIPFTKYRPDAWHLSKSLMVILFCTAIVTYHSFIPIIDFIIYGLLWNLIFNITYKLFKL